MGRIFDDFIKRIIAFSGRLNCGISSQTKLFYKIIKGIDVAVVMISDYMCEERYLLYDNDYQKQNDKSRAGLIVPVEEQSSMKHENVDFHIFDANNIVFILYASICKLNELENGSQDHRRSSGRWNS